MANIQMTAPTEVQNRWERIYESAPKEMTRGQLLDQALDALERENLITAHPDQKALIESVNRWMKNVRDSVQTLIDQIETAKEDGRAEAARDIDNANEARDHAKAELEAVKAERDRLKEITDNVDQMTKERDEARALADESSEREREMREKMEQALSDAKLAKADATDALKAAAKARDEKDAAEKQLRDIRDGHAVEIQKLKDELAESEKSRAVAESKAQDVDDWKASMNDARKERDQANAEVARLRAELEEVRKQAG